MKHWMQCLWVSAVFLACVLPFSSVEAQGRSRSIELRVTVGPGMLAELEYLGRPRGVVLRCEGECGGEYQRGHYKLTLHQQQHSDSIKISLGQPMHYTGTPPDYTLKYAGLTSALGGGALAISGLVSASFGLLPFWIARLFGLTTEFKGHVEMGAQDWYGVIAVPTGVVLNIVGLILYQHNRQPFAREPIERVQLHLSPSARGMVGSLQVGF
jgi:hypothetical protein